jgi:hypothetical protein
MKGHDFRGLEGKCAVEERGRKSATAKGGREGARECGGRQMCGRMLCGGRMYVT